MNYRIRIKLWLYKHYWLARFRVRHLLSMIPYPWMYLLQHPIHVIRVAWDYRQRRLGRRPDRWHPSDLKLMGFNTKAWRDITR